jgi:hypothetical protein
MTKLDWLTQLRLHRREITPAQAFLLAVTHDANTAAGVYSPAMDALSPFMGPGAPPRLERTEDMWTMEVPRILNIGGATVRELLKAHESTVEARADLSPCEKNARRRVVLAAWQASPEYPEQAQPVAPPVELHPTHSGAGVR